MSARKKNLKRQKQTHLYNTQSKAPPLLVLLLYMINVYATTTSVPTTHSSTAGSITVSTSTSGIAHVANPIPPANPSVQPPLNPSHIAAQQQQLLSNLLDDGNDEHADENKVEVTVGLCDGLFDMDNSHNTNSLTRILKKHQSRVRFSYQHQQPSPPRTILASASHAAHVVNNAADILSAFNLPLQPPFASQPAPTVPFPPAPVPAVPAPAVHPTLLQAIADKISSSSQSRSRLTFHAPNDHTGLRVLHALNELIAEKNEESHLGDR